MTAALLFTPCGISLLCVYIYVYIYLCGLCFCDSVVISRLFTLASGCLCSILAIQVSFLGKNAKTCAELATR